MTPSAQQLEKARHASGFIAALDQSGGSTPKALGLYGIDPSTYSGDDEMFAKVHEMRTRIITNPAFNGDKILGAILFENTMDRAIAGTPTARYLWEQKNIIPILKVDKGLSDEANGVQLMKPMPDLPALLTKANAAGIFATKMRSVIKHADPAGIAAVVAQQFAVAKIIMDHALIPIIEPEVDIHSPEKAEAEALLKKEIANHLEHMREHATGDMPNEMNCVVFKLTLPETANFYREFIDHPNCLRVVALSGGYSREESCQRLSQNNGMIASFSRALTEGLNVDQSAQEFTAMLRASIDAIVAASST